MQLSLRTALTLRVRLIAIGVFVVGGFLPPYVPGDAVEPPPPEELAALDTQFFFVEDGFLMKSSSLTQQGSRRAYAEGIVHTVQTGESVERIADTYGINAETILWANNLDRDSVLKPNQELIILPVDGVLHVVKRGQTLLEIADLYDVPLDEISAQNNVQGNFILAGQQLIVPGGSPIIPDQPVIASQPTTPTGPKPSVTPEPERPTPVAVAPAAQVAPTYGAFQMPCNSCIYTQYYHGGHYAVDIQTRGGGPIFAAEKGTVIRSDEGWNGGYGNVIEVDHGNGLVTLYAHNKENLVDVGDDVVRGQHIANMGNTGRVYGKTGIHVHFEVRQNGVKKNPLLYLK